LVARIADRVEQHTPHAGLMPRRIAAVALTAVMLITLGAAGGMSYAASGAEQVIDVAKDLSGSSKNTSKPAKSAAEAQYQTTICHRTGPRNNPSWQEITVNNSALPAHAAHGDIIPAPAGGCPS
jgi:hypothetical protein